MEFYWDGEDFDALDPEGMTIGKRAAAEVRAAASEALAEAAVSRAEAAEARERPLLEELNRLRSRKQ